MVPVAVKKSSCSTRNISRTKVVVGLCLFLFLILMILSSWQTLASLKIVVHFDSKRDIMEDRRDDVQELIKAVDKLRGDDNRLVQWDATKHTIKYQTRVCPRQLPIAISNLLDTNILQSVVDGDSALVIQFLQASLEICILCITDNPSNRALFSEGKKQNGDGSSTTSTTTTTTTIHRVVVDLLQIEPLLPSAAHLIYIATFANRLNHLGFINANAVLTLSEIIVNSNDVTLEQPQDDEEEDRQHTPYSKMWVAAALQNLAASYCTTPDDGRCYWEWKKKRQPASDTDDNGATKPLHEYTLQLTSDSGKMIVDGSWVRQEMVTKTPTLIERLIQYACSGPVNQTMSKSYPYPGHNAIHWNEHLRHELSPTIVPWAAAGVLKNLLLDPDIRTTFLQQQEEGQYSTVTSCFCYLSKSNDWLEANKGEGALQHLRIDSDPCWFNYQSRRRSKKERKKTKEASICIDRIFIDSTGSTCEAYNDEDTLTFEDCATPSILLHPDTDTQNELVVVASDACCPCGGGDYYSGPGHPA